VIASRIALLAAAAVLTAACGGGEAAQKAVRATAGAVDGGLDFGRVETVARGFEVPWAVAFAGRRTILVTERPGRIRLISGGRLRAAPVARLPVIADGEGGLLGLALDPGFPRRRFAYVYYTARDGNRVSRFRLTAGLRFRDERVLIRRIPAASIHDGGRIAFGPDGMLYVTAGESGIAALAPDRRSIGGKVLRIRPDGSIPRDNPFRGSPVFSYGHRNPQGLGWDARGRLYEAEHGPTGEGGFCCHDEVNRIVKGRFYGWPYRAGRMVTSRGTPPATPVAPLAESGDDTWAPSGLAVYEHRGSTPLLFVGALSGERLLRFRIGSSGRLTPLGSVLRGYGRLREVHVGPDRCLYVTTSNQDGRGTPHRGDDRLLRVCPRR
jgi:aldose sugar dehydrogenase